MIRMTAENCGGTVQLLSKYDAGEAVRQSHRTKRQRNIASFKNACPVTVGTADQERA